MDLSVQFSLSDMSLASLDQPKPWPTMSSMVYVFMYIILNMNKCSFHFQKSLVLHSSLLLAISCVIKLSLL